MFIICCISNLFWLVVCQYAWFSGEGSHTSFKWLNYKDFFEVYVLFCSIGLCSLSFEQLSLYMKIDSKIMNLVLVLAIWVLQLCSTEMLGLQN